ncbi:MAG: hypothetical protein Q9226_006618 [Calogaya cf. arnoldii]
MRNSSPSTSRLVTAVISSILVLPVYHAATADQSCTRSRYLPLPPSPLVLNPSGLSEPSAHRVLPSQRKNPQILLQDADNGFGFARANPRPPEPRQLGVTEIRGPYYSVMGKSYLSDVLETWLMDTGSPSQQYRHIVVRDPAVEDLRKAGRLDGTPAHAPHVFTVVDKYLKRCADWGELE